MLLSSFYRTNTPVVIPEIDYVETVDGVDVVMKAIPGGIFMMGCGVEDEPCTDEEWVDKSHNQRQRQVHVDPFFLAETETTWALYQLCIDTSQCPGNDAEGGDNGWGKETRPVIEVSWNEVTQMFIPWLNKKTGKHYRLPTESEWEYAARAGTTTRYSWGKEIDCTRARYGYTSGECGTQASTDPVKSYQPNAFGLYDMHGNVWEFVDACWEDTNAGRSTPVGASCKEIVIRGGSWLNKPAYLRSATRYLHDRTYRESGDGFRLAHGMQ